MRSPIVATGATRAPSTAPCHQGPSRVSGIAIAPTSAHEMTDPAKPSQDFFGDSFGAIGCLPSRTPKA